MLILLLLLTCFCSECDYCIHLLLDDMDILNRNVITVRRQLADVSVGVAAFQRLEEYNNSVSILKVRRFMLKRIKRKIYCLCYGEAVCMCAYICVYL